MFTPIVALVVLLGSSDLENRPEIPTHPGELTLAQALEYAEANNERIGIADAAVDRARAGYRRALAALLPSVNANGRYTRRGREASNRNFGRRNALNATASGQIDLIKPDAYPRVSAATDDVDAARSDAAQERLSLRFDAAEQFLATLAAERVAEAALNRVAVAQSAVDEASARFEAGLDAGNTVTRAQLELATARVTATETANTAEIARLTLSFTLGVDVTGQLVEPTGSRSTATAPERLYDIARKSRPDLAALRHRKQAAENRELAPSLDWLPELSVNGVTTWTNESGFGPNTNWNVSAILGWQLFDGGVRLAEALEASAEMKNAELQIRALERSVRLEIENQLRQIGTRKALLAEAEARMEVAKRNATEVQQRLAAGLVTGLEAADAAAQLFDAEAELERQRFEARIAELALRRVVASDPLDPVRVD